MMPRFSAGGLSIRGGELVGSEVRTTRAGPVWELLIQTEAGELVCSYFPTDGEVCPTRRMLVDAMVTGVRVFRDRAQFSLGDVRFSDLE